MIQVCVTSKKEFKGSRDFLWTRKVLLRDDVEHSSRKNVETTRVSARQKRRGEKTRVKECAKPYRNSPVLVVVHNSPVLVVDNCDINLRRTLFWDECRVPVHCTLCLFKVTDRFVSTTQVMIGSCQLNILLSELFRWNGDSTIMMAPPLPANHLGRDIQDLNHCRLLPHQHDQVRAFPDDSPMHRFNIL